MSFTLETQTPFGIIIRNTGTDDSLQQFSPQQIKDWISEHKLIVFRGYRSMPKQELALYGQQLGKPLQWAFGAINELQVKKDTENYIFTDHAVPMHWDGAFAGKIPHIILFQCLVAPAKEDLGGTTFADTEKIVAEASASQKEEWQKISVTYSTKKIVHYGGKIEQKLLTRHVTENKVVLRYAEPVDDLNPVKLEVHGLGTKSQPDFIAEMQKLLYDPRYLYTHRWEAGDIVMADNHTLLHGREAFKNPNSRHIQRINILERPAGFSIMRFLSNCLTIRRKEFFVAELPIFLIPLILCMGSLTKLSDPMLYVGLAAIIMLFNVGDMINCYADYELDAIYKSHLSNAVYELGRKNVLLQILLSGALGLLLTALVAAQTGRYYLFYITLAGTFIGLQYSIKPFHFKSRGLWQLLCLWGIIFFGPMLYTGIITNGFPGTTLLMLFALYGFHQMGIIMLNTAEDFTEDKATGLNTVIISLGLQRAMLLAYWLVIICGFLMQALMAWLMFLNKMPWFMFASILVFTAGWLVIIMEYRKVILKIRPLDDTAAVNEIKKNGMKVPRWLKIGAYSFLAVVIIYMTRMLVFADIRYGV